MMSLRPARAALALAAVAAVVALSGCSSPGSSFTGTWGSSAAGQPNLTIKDDGTFSGNDGCNDMSGKGTVSGDTFTFGPFASTLKACDGVNPWLSRANTAKISGGDLVVYANGGEKVGTLAKG
ncbi:META domain-containing protein [Leifsonia naganoensis]|uniref:Heat shock protein HslJ n=1 Tax=Leifsonia naganoensis TaxID=150025 RepID=A0A853DN44_9MICO|nr:META domain-containing protein [Leifsonia naganoensis]NYK09707.1 heat shock protein HslJ [Leifsonia naganoensis]